MTRSYEKNRPTRELILQTAMRMFLEAGYSATSSSRITKELKISPGNMTFYFPTKEHLLSELVEELCNFQWKVMEEITDEGKSSLYAYCMELATMTSLCEVSPTAKDFYLAAYTHPMPLEIIRRNDTRKAQEVFRQYCPEFREVDFICAENIVSGIEYATLATRTTEEVTLERKVTYGLDSILKLYNVPEELRRLKIEKVMTSGFQGQGKDLLREFIEFTEAVNAEAVRNALEYKLHHQR